MSWTKRQFIQAAFEEIGLATYIFDIETDQLQTVVKKLDAMMGLWDSKGVNIGFPIATNPEDADLDTETNAPDAANEAIYLNLAIRIAPGYGKVLRRALLPVYELPHLQGGQKGDVPRKDAELPLNPGKNDLIHLLRDHDPLRCNDFQQHFSCYRFRHGYSGQAAESSIFLPCSTASSMVPTM